MPRAVGGTAFGAEEDTFAVQSNGSVRHNISRAVRYRARNCSLAKERHIGHYHLAGGRQRAGSAPAVSGGIAALNRKRAQRDEIEKELALIVGGGADKSRAGQSNRGPAAHGSGPVAPKRRSANCSGRRQSKIDVRRLIGRKISRYLRAQTAREVHPDDGVGSGSDAIDLIETRGIGAAG